MKNTGIKISLFINYFVFAALLNSVGILVERSQEAYAVTKSQAAVLEPFKDLSIAIVAFLIGSFLPKIGYKKAMLISLAMVFFGCLGMYFGDSFWMVKLLFAMTGMGFAIVKVSVFALISYVTETKKNHSSFMSLIETVFMLGILFIYFVFPIFYSDTNPNAWLNGYLFMAALILISFLIILSSKFNLEKPPKTSLSEDYQSTLKLLLKPLIWVFIAFAFFYVMTEQGIMTWLPTFNKETLKLPPKIGTQMAGILLISIATGRFITGIIAKKIKWIYIASVSVILAIALVLLVLPMAQNITPKEINSIGDLPVVSFLFPLIGLFLAPLYPLINSTVLTSTDKAHQSHLAGLLTFWSAIGGTVGSLIIGNLFDTLGGDKVFYLSLIPFTLIFISLFFINKLTISDTNEG